MKFLDKEVKMPSQIAKDSNILQNHISAVLNN